MIRTLIALALALAVPTWLRICFWLSDRRPPVPASLVQRIMRARDAYERDLAALTAREPAGQVILIRLPRRIAVDECGCLWLAGGYWSPCIGHDPGFEPPVGQWAAEMEDS